MDTDNHTLFHKILMRNLQMISSAQDLFSLKIVLLCYLSIHKPKPDLGHLLYIEHGALCDGNIILLANVTANTLPDEFLESHVSSLLILSCSSSIQLVPDHSSSFLLSVSTGLIGNICSFLHCKPYGFFSYMLLYYLHL